MRLSLATMKEMAMTEQQIHVISGGDVTGDDRRKISRVVGEIEVGILYDKTIVPVRNYEADEGYQRPASPKRVKDLTSDLLKKRVDLPTALLLNIREFDPARHLRPNNCGGMSLFVSADDHFYVVDGQHRLAALKAVINEDEEHDTTAPSMWRTYKLPFVCLLGATESEEMRQFYVVNSTAKSVSTDLAYDLLRVQAQKSPEVRDALIEGGDMWKVKGQELADHLKDAGPWEGRIRFPNAKKLKTTIPSAGMVNSLKPLLDGSYLLFSQAELEEQATILTAYWSGILRVLPEVGEAPEKYTLQKMTGAVVMHAILPAVMDYLRSEGHSLLSAENYGDALKASLDSLSEENREGVVVSGADFWLSGAGGAAGAYSSNAGRRVIKSRILTHLPRPKIR